MFRCLSTLVLALATVVIAVDINPDDLERIIESSVNLRTHSIFAPYVDQDLQNRWFSFGADAYVNTNKHVRLTRDRPSETGWLWSRLPITNANFQIDVEFKITGGGGHVYGDGLAMWLTTRRAISGPVFGFEDKFEGLGIFIDTFANERHSYAFPRIMAMIGDGQTTYDLGNDGESNSVAGCSANVRELEIATKLRVTYIKGQFLDVRVQYKAWDEWTHCFTILDPKIPSSPFLGFSALTGEVSEAHDIISVTTSTLVLNKALAGLGSGAIHSKHSGQAGSSFFGSLFSFIWKLLFVAVFGVVGFAGWKAYTARNGTPNLPWDSKRF